MHRHGAGGHGGLQRLGRGPFLVRAVHSLVQARVLGQAEVEVAPEAARGEHDALGGADSRGLAALHVVIEGPIAHDGTDHAAVLVLDKLNEHALGLHVHAHLAEFRGQGLRDVGAAAVHGLADGAHDGVAAVGVQPRLAVLVFVPGAAHLHGPLPGLVGLLGDDAALLLVVEAQAGNEHVAHEGVHGILDALAGLHLRAAYGHVAGGEGGIAAHAVRLLDDLHVGPGALRLDGRGEPGVAASHDEHLALLVPADVGGRSARGGELLVPGTLGRTARKAEGGQGAGHGGAGDKGTAGEARGLGDGHILHGVLLKMTVSPAASSDPASPA